MIHLLNNRGQVCKNEDDLERKLVHVRPAELCLSNRYLCYCSRCLRHHRFAMSLFNSPKVVRCFYKENSKFRKCHSTSSITGNTLIALSVVSGMSINPVYIS